jgi:hypothetical protein
MESPCNGVGVGASVILEHACVLTEKVKRSEFIPQCSSGGVVSGKQLSDNISFVIGRHCERYSSAYMNSRKGREKAEQIHYPKHDNNNNKPIQDGFDA